MSFLSVREETRQQKVWTDGTFSEEDGLYVSEQTNIAPGKTQCFVLLANERELVNTATSCDIGDGWVCVSQPTSQVLGSQF